ncbi:MAG: N-formylglutamate amidohydrolase [Verrucomicrobia bacterium]|nr:N-formylglutamate amidohydrolase [Verrucomicrobiota bacterium]MDA1086930.1 N-formylglutamate amidohydrolase [Verrucomicrobiota bacterium]
MGNHGTDRIWMEVEGEGPLIAVALHDGHDIRGEVRELSALADEDRLREEDPGSGSWTDVAPTRIVGLRSRFEVDLNRLRNEAVYIKPVDAWGLDVWASPPPVDLIERSLAEYDLFYENLRQILERFQQRYGRFVILDLHSYNFRRAGPDGPVADPDGNPEVNIGSGTMNREFWAPVVDRLIADLRAFDFGGAHLDVRENVKFYGRGFPRFVHETFPESGCAIAIEFKKFFMDEWSGVLFHPEYERIQEALASVVPGVLATLEEMG